MNDLDDLLLDALLSALDRDVAALHALLCLAKVRPLGTNERERAKALEASVARGVALLSPHGEVSLAEGFGVAPC